MSKEPQRMSGVPGSRPGAPYAGASRPAPSASSSGAAASASPTHSALPRLTVHNFRTFQTRIKKLPPDANVTAATHVRLYQLPDRVCFGCAKCRRDNIQSDSVAVDERNKVILCAHCFTRIIRPRQYRPSRVVPFPSLLSWLNYKPAAATTVSEDVLERPAEAVAPSGERRAAPMLGRGDRASAIARLPNIATKIVPTPGPGGARGNQRGGNHAQAKGSSSSKHPCVRVWGVCLHGDLCRFREAPAELCLAHLMGLCGGPHAENAPAHGGRHRGRRGGPTRSAVADDEASGSRDGYASEGRPPPSQASRRPCRLLHQAVYDLPNPMARSTMPAVRYPGDIDAPTAAEASHDEEGGEDAEDGVVTEHVRAMRENRRLWQKWLEKRMNSPNSAEWQLWNNGPVRALFDQFVPLTPRPVEPGASAAVTKPEPEEEAEVADVAPAPAPGETKVKLNLSDIQSALRGLQP